MFRRVIASAAALLLIAIAAGVFRLATKDWQASVPCNPSEVRDRHLAGEFLSDAPVERRYAGLFRYFARGFVDHLDPTGSRVQYCGAPSNNTYPMSGVEGFARTAPLLAAWAYSGRDVQFADPESGRRVDLLDLLRRGILAGVDPQSPGYWGAITDNGQRIVEAADIARILWMTRTRLWD